MCLSVWKNTQRKLQVPSPKAGEGTAGQVQHVTNVSPASLSLQQDLYLLPAMDEQ